MALTVVGVRHHSPACARLVRATIERLRPRVVLIEGPADMNERLDELALPHELPVAIFSYHQSSDARGASWAPFCDYSPEWVALEEGRRVGAELYFMDLPAWASGFGERANRYSDGHDVQRGYVQELCARLGVEGMDALWDHLFEQPMATAALAERLQTYFRSLRGDLGAGADEAREAFMARYVAWAMATTERDGGDVVVVCGGYHAPALEVGWQELAGQAPPELPAAPAGSRSGSYLVPYTFRRLDAFAGYQSGMPSPAYYQRVWEVGPEAAPEQMLGLAVKHLRAKKQQVSSADLVGVWSMVHGLTRLRGHDVATRVDLLDGLASALLKQPQEVPFPWSGRGLLAAGTDPKVVAVLTAFSGERRGHIAEGTPQPPLVHDVERILADHDLTPQTAPRSIALDLTMPVDRTRSAILHRLRVLRIEGFDRISGPSWATEPVLEERWQLQEHVGATASIIEAAAHGATLEAAVGALLRKTALDAEDDIEALVAVLGEAIFVGLAAIADDVLAVVAVGAGHERSFARLGPALGRVLGLWRHDVLFDAAAHPSVGLVLEAIFDRCLWLAEGLRGPEAVAEPAEVAGFIALRDTLRSCAGALAIDRNVAHQVLDRCAADGEAPPAVRGAALGVLWCDGAMSDDAARERTAEAIRDASRPATLGDFLAGLFAVGREVVSNDPTVAGTLDDVISHFRDEDFLVALPSLRLAFGYFPPRERERIAQAIAARHGASPGAGRALMRTLTVAPEVRIAAARLEAELDRREVAYGLSPNAAVEEPSP